MRRTWRQCRQISEPSPEMGDSTDAVGEESEAELADRRDNVTYDIPNFQQQALVPQTLLPRGAVSPGRWRVATP